MDKGFVFLRYAGASVWAFKAQGGFGEGNKSVAV